MPNWCYNSLSLNHSDDEYLQQVGKQLLSVINKDNLVSMDYEMLDDKVVISLFDILCPNYDIKQFRPNISHIDVDSKTHTIRIVFDTAWMPPIEMYNHLLNNDWIIDALYHEPNSEFCGSFTNEKGDEMYEYDSNDKSSYNNLPVAILDFTCLLDDQTEYNTEDEDENDEDTKIYDEIYSCCNKCCNQVKFTTCDVNLLNALNNSLKNNDYEIFNLLCPRPSTEELSEDHWNQKILDWNQNAWGTKCEPKIISYHRNDEATITIEFDTAATPPLKLYTFLVEEGWNIDAIYYENYKGICGSFKNEQGNISYQYNKKDISSILKLPNTILEFSHLLETYEGY